MEVIIGDLETMLEMFLCVFYNPQEDKWERWEVSAYRNELDGLIAYMDRHQEEYYVFYNGLRFDTQVLEFILRNHHNWIDKSGLEICAIISQLAQDTIDDGNYDVFPQYREEQLSFKTIDPFTVQHYDNKNRRVSLKRLMFEMDEENIEELPFPYDKKNLTRDDCDEIIHYCDNDVISLYHFYLILRGRTEHPLYKEYDQIELRQDIEEEFGIPCLNYSMAKIGDEIIKKYYCEAKRINYSDLPKKGTFRKFIALKYCIPKYVNFQTPQLQQFLKRIKGMTLSQSQDFEESIHFYNQVYTFARGGLHNVINGKTYTADEENDLVDVDVSGYYPASIINCSYFPAHLGRDFLMGYSKVYYKRIPLKSEAKTNKKIKGIVAGLKEAGNCPYGKSSDMTSWLYDKQMTLATCLTGELSLLMLIEDCELAGIKCIMANTDGATFIVPKDKRELFNSIKEEWRQEITITLTYELEEVEYQKLIFSTVNDYVALKKDGTYKVKGDFEIDKELHKNKSGRIIPIALKEYYVNNIPVEETIKHHTNIYDFCLRQKSSKDFHYEGINRKTGEKEVYNKLIRYYMSNSGKKLYKIKNESCTTNAAPISEVHAGEWLSCVCNYLPKTTKIESCDINFQYYIDRAERIIRKIKAEGKKIKEIKEIPGQMLLF